MRIEMHGRRALLALFVGLAGVVLAAGCEDNPPPPTDVGESPIKIDEIILTPKSALPGDTIALTVVVTSKNGAPNVGDFPVVEWTADDGTFLENNQLSVRWEAPANTGLIGITCRATNSINSIDADSRVFVGTPIVLVPAEAGEIHLTDNGNDFYFLRTLDPTLGNSVGSYLGGVEGLVSILPNENRVIAPLPDVSFSASSSFTIRSGNLDQEKNVILLDFASGIEDTITSDPHLPTDSRHDQYDYPSISPQANLVGYQGMKPFPIKGAGVDTMDVYVYDVMAQTTQNVTETHKGPPGADPGRRRNMFPTFSSDSNWLVFVSDRTGINQWELYALPMLGNVAETDSSATERLTFSSGRITASTPNGIPKPPMKWSPSAASPVLAVLSADEILFLVAMNGGGGVQTPVTGVEGRIRQFVWNDTGQMLALTNFSQIYTVDLAGNSTPIHSVPSTDRVGDMVWSRDGQWIVYRAVRGGGSWFEILDVDAGTLLSPAVITAVTASTNVSAYGLRMSVAPAYSANNELFLLEWTGTATTPRVTLLDISTVVQ